MHTRASALPGRPVALTQTQVPPLYQEGPEKYNAGHREARPVTHGLLGG